MGMTTERFARLFSGLETAYGTSVGGWVHQPVTLGHYEEHLAGKGPGLGINPLKNDKVTFAAIDLDEPDFDTAQTLVELLPGSQFIERSRSGNAHIWTFFSDPIDAWVPRGIMREACAAVDKRFVEVFPKQDRLRVGMVGNYINLPYYGNTRPILFEDEGALCDMDVLDFLDAAERSLNKPSDWTKRAHWLGIPSPSERVSEGREFGTQSVLHMCAEHVLENRDSNPIVEGHRAVVYFALCKQFANCNQYTTEESLAILGMINDASPDPIPEIEMKHMMENAIRGQYTSTGCDDPLFAPYAHPDCPIANGDRR